MTLMTTKISVVRPAAIGLAALLVALGGSARAQESPEGDAPAPDEDVPGVFVEPAPEPEADDEGAAPEDAPVPEDEPSPEDEIPPDIWGPEPDRTPTWVHQSIARDTKMRLKYVRAYQAAAIKALRERRHADAIEACKKALAIDPENLAIETLSSLAKRKLQEHRLRLEGQRSKAMDEEALGEVVYESTFPGPVSTSARPRYTLREDTPETEGSRRMKALLNQSVSMNFVEADLEYVLQTLFKISNVNIIADNEILSDKTLSLHVENVPLSEILDFIKRNYEGVDYTVTEHSVLLTTPEKPPLYPKAYPLSHGLIGQESFRTGTRRTSSGSGNGGYLGNYGGSTSNVLGRNTNTRSNRGGGSSNRGGGGGSAGSGESYLEELLTWVEGWEEEWPQGSQWHLDRQSNTLFVLTTSEMHRHVDAILDVIDTTPIQVLVRAKFIEADANDLIEVGLGFMFVDNDALANEAVQDVVDAAQTPASMTHGALSFNNIYTISAGKLMADLQLLQEKRRTKVLSAPQIIAMSNKRATIDVSKSFSYATQYQSSQTSVYAGAGGVSAGDISSAFVPSSYEELTAGFFLEFIPSVGRDMKTITLDLHARIDEVKNIDQFEETPVIMAVAGQTPPAIPRPVVDAREITTQIVIEDGYAVVIGGLLKNNTEIINRKIPILGDIPLLGIPFRYRKEVTRQSNLLIIVQAQIVKPDGGRYVDSDKTPAEPPRFGMQSFGSAPKKTEWIRDLPPELQRDILRGAGR